jgi:hypothetical protein
MAGAVVTLLGRRLVVPRLFAPAVLLLLSATLATLHIASA